MKRTLTLAILILILVGISAPAWGELEYDPDTDLYCRVVDVGVGSCYVVSMPGDFYMVYDAGDWYSATKAEVMEALKAIIPAHEEIDLLVLSHTDADHIGAVPEICRQYSVARVIRAGWAKDTQTWEKANDAVLREKQYEGCIDINLRYFEFPPGGVYRFGDTFVQFVCGFSRPPEEWGQLSSSEKRNAGSIVIRVMYRGRSILFAGDAVGLHLKEQNAERPIATEKFMVDNADVIPIDSDVLIAPHHGSKGGSHVEFIKAVSPEWVVFSAGHKHGHPTMDAYQRYLDSNVSEDNILRTDRWDYEMKKDKPHPDHWHDPRAKEGDKDRLGDDDIEIVFFGDNSKEPKVAYRSKDPNE